MAYGDKPFGLKQLVIYSADGTGAVTLPVSLMMHVTPVIETARFVADGVGVGASAMVTLLEWELEAGGLNLDAYAKLTGLSVATAGSNPNRTQTLSVGAGLGMPYLRIYGRAVGDAGDGMVVKLYKVKLESIEGAFRRGDFYITSCAGVAVKHSSLGLVDFVGQETKTAL
jgi:hypothetical protein